ncbi:MAG: hypothetical protein EP329_15875 [Deltaproteobacteria bacterium]|nr:MAG: hypothetical protein EP329_15875 [Deltaproteobacteria bacterium]
MTVVRALVARERIELIGTDEQVARDLAAFLATRKGHSLISSTSRGLLASEHVDELFADDDEIKAIVDELGENKP